MKTQLASHRIYAASSSISWPQHTPHTGTVPPTRNVAPGTALRVFPSPAHMVALLAIIIALATAWPVRAQTAPASSASAPTVRVAAAADLQFALQELATQFERTSRTHIAVSYGSSGNFYAQLQNGAPFDLFFSADMDYAKKLDAAGFAEPGTLNKYALGKLVLWTPADALVDVTKDGWLALLDPRITKIAIANPEHAPYGRAAVAALLSAGIYEQVKSKLVYGDNISQAAQFVQSGNAQAGLVALSLALAPAMKDGKRWEVPAGAYPLIEQGAIVMKSASDKAAARAFLDFILSPTGRDTLGKYGFSFEAAAAPAK